MYFQQFNVNLFQEWRFPIKASWFPFGLPHHPILVIFNLYYVCGKLNKLELEFEPLLSKTSINYKRVIPGVVFSSGYETIGCYRDTGNRAIKTLEGTDPILDGRYWTRKDSIAKCAVAAMRKGYSMFAVQHGGWCAGSIIAPHTFNKYGKSTACGGDGEGGGWANQVYLIKSKCAFIYIALLNNKMSCLSTRHLIESPNCQVFRLSLCCLFRQPAS